MGEGTYCSEAKDQFVAKPIDRVLGKGLQASLDLGDGTRQFSTQYGQTHTGQPQPDQKHITKEEIKRMRV
jgi:hypothetical protein